MTARRATGIGMGALVLAIGALGTVAPAAAGGPTFSFDREVYRPGEVATGVAGIFLGQHGTGSAEEGPYYAYLVPDDPTLPAGRRIPPDAVLLGEIAVGTGPIDEGDGQPVGPDHARVRFTVPDVAPGDYEVLQCSDPCTTSLADLRGTITVDAPRVTAAAAAGADAGGGAWPPPAALAALAALAAAVLAGSTWGLARRRPSRTTGAGGAGRAAV